VISYSIWLFKRSSRIRSSTTTKTSGFWIS